jgi:dihydrofolate reductase
MRNLIVSEFLTVDGVMEAPGGEDHPHAGWVFDFQSPEQNAYKLAEVMEAGSLLLGRVTYEGFAGAWPGRDDPQGFAAKMNAMPKHVASTTLDHLEWENSTLLEGDVPQAVAALKAGAGDPILVAGSRTLVQGLAAHDLVDEYRLMIFPVLLGSGRRLFADGLADKTALELVDSQTFSSGVVNLTYRPRR